MFLRFAVKERLNLAMFSGHDVQLVGSLQADLTSSAYSDRESPPQRRSLWDIHILSMQQNKVQVGMETTNVGRGNTYHGLLLKEELGFCGEGHLRTGYLPLVTVVRVVG